MTTIWFLSDPHFGHAACVHTFKRQDGSPLRDFHSVIEMNETIIENWNNTVMPQDHAYLMGDIAMKREFLPLVRRLNGHKRLLFGNHDIFDYKTYAKDAGFEKMMAMRVMDRIIFSHVPVHPGQLQRFKANVHGHTHQNFVMKEGRPDPQYMNVCCEVINYTPISLEQIKQRLA